MLLDSARCTVTVSRATAPLSESLSMQTTFLNVVPIRITHLSLQPNPPCPAFRNIELGSSLWCGKGYGSTYWTHKFSTTQRNKQKSSVLQAYTDSGTKFAASFFSKHLSRMKVFGVFLAGAIAFCTEAIAAIAAEKSPELNKGDETKSTENSQEESRKKSKPKSKKREKDQGYIDPVVGFSLEFDPRRFAMSEVRTCAFPVLLICFC